MAADLKKELRASVELIESSGGVFEIETGGNLLYSKKALGRFPAEGEVLTIIRQMASSAKK